MDRAVPFERSGLVGYIDVEMLAVDVEKSTAVCMAWKLAEVICLESCEFFGADACCLRHVAKRKTPCEARLSKSCTRAVSHEREYCCSAPGS